MQRSGVDKTNFTAWSVDNWVEGNVGNVFNRLSGKLDYMSHHPKPLQAGVGRICEKPLLAQFAPNIVHQ